MTHQSTNPVVESIKWPVKVSETMFKHRTCIRDSGPDNANHLSVLKLEEVCRRANSYEDLQQRLAKAEERLETYQKALESIKTQPFHGNYEFAYKGIQTIVRNTLPPKDLNE